MVSSGHDDATLPRRTYDLADAQRVFANVSSGLFGSESAPSRIGRFVLIEKVGSGGMGVVYSAFDPELQRRVALKLLHEADGAAAPGSALLREARALARLHHPNIAAIYEVGSVDRGVFIAMEYVDGTTLRDWARSAPAFREVVDAFQQVAEGLAHAHEQGLIHRDVKPANLVKEAGGRTVVLDFGLAKFGRGDPGREGLPASPSSVTQADGTFGLVGTPAYMAPEQLQGEPATAASDQFSLCVSLYEVLCGKRPFRATSPMALHAEVQKQSFEPLPSATPGWLVKLVERGLRADAGDRWPSLAVLSAELRRGRRPWLRRFLLPVAVASTALATAVAAGRQPEDPCGQRAEEVGQVWNQEARAQVSSALETRVSDDARNYALAEIDGFAAALAAARAKACEREPSQASRGQQTCLTAELTRLRTTVGLLREPDQEIAKNVLRMAPHADSLGNCESPSVAIERLPAGARTEFERTLARAAAFVDAGRTEVGRELAASTVASARSAGDEALLARAELGLGRALVASGDPNEAVDVFQSSLVHAEQAADDGGRLFAIRELAGALIKTSKYDEAERLLSIAAATQRRFETHPVSWDFQAEDAAAELATARRDFAGALEHYRRAEQIANGEGGTLGQRLAVQSAIGGTLFRLQRYDEALEVIRKLRKERLRVHGEDDLGLAVSDSLVGVISMVTGDFPSAEVALRRALHLRERVQGPEHPALSGVLTNLGALLLSIDPDQAVPILERAVARAERGHGPFSSRASKAHYSLGRAYLDTGRAGEALRAFRRSSEIREKTGEPADPELLIARARMAQAAEELGNYRLAHREFDQVAAAVAAADDTSGVDNNARAEALAYAHAGRARCFLAAGDELAAHLAGREAVEVARSGDLGGTALAEALITAALVGVDPADEALPNERLERASQALQDGAAHRRLRAMLEEARAIAQSD